MQWILQPIEDGEKLAAALDRRGIAYERCSIVPFAAALSPEPKVRDPHAVVLFGAYAMQRVAAARGWRPGVFRIRPFVHEAPWRPYLLNGDGARFLRVDEIETALAGDEGFWFARPVSDAKELPGAVHEAAALRGIARRVMATAPGDLPIGALRPGTALMLSPPARILREWRVWIIGGRPLAWSLYKEGGRVVERREIDPEALAMAERLSAANPDYSPAYVMDLCRTHEGVFMLETNCINAAGFYAADLDPVVAAIEAMG